MRVKGLFSFVRAMASSDNGEHFKLEAILIPVVNTYFDGLENRIRDMGKNGKWEGSRRRL